MGKLEEESKLFKNLSEKYDSKATKGIAPEFFSECIDEAKKVSKREVQFVLFKLKYLYADIDTGEEKVNALAKTIRLLAGNELKVAFIMTVLETALSEQDDYSRQTEYIESIEKGFEFFDEIENEMIRFSKRRTGYIDVKRDGETLTIKADYSKKDIEAVVTITKNEIIDKVIAEGIDPKQAICDLLTEKICRAAKEF